MAKKLDDETIKKNRYAKAEEYVGKKYGHLLVISINYEKTELEFSKGHFDYGVYMNCLCDCGKNNIICTSLKCLKNGHSTSCGCKRIAYLKNVTPITYKKENQTELCNEYIKLFNSNHTDFCMIDKEDYNLIKQYCWYKDSNGYWVSNNRKQDGTRETIKLHQEIATIKYGEYDKKSLLPDHLNRNKSDNRKQNLLLKNRRDNSINRSLSKRSTTGKTGVNFYEKYQKYVAKICVNYKTIHLGYFDKFDDAVEARLKAEEKYGYTCDDVYPDSDIAKGGNK